MPVEVLIMLAGLAAFCGGFLLVEFAFGGREHRRLLAEIRDTKRLLIALELLSSTTELLIERGQFKDADALIRAHELLFAENERKQS